MKWSELLNCYSGLQLIKYYRYAKQGIFKRTFSYVWWEIESKLQWKVRNEGNKYDTFPKNLAIKIRKQELKKISFRASLVFGEKGLEKREKSEDMIKQSKKKKRETYAHTHIYRLKNTSDGKKTEDREVDRSPRGWGSRAQRKSPTFQRTAASPETQGRKSKM